MLAARLHGVVLRSRSATDPGEVGQEIDQPKDAVNIRFQSVLIKQPHDAYRIASVRFLDPVWAKECHR
jgi:hypothetical protein